MCVQNFMLETKNKIYLWSVISVLLLYCINAQLLVKLVISSRKFYFPLRWHHSCPCFWWMLNKEQLGHTRGKLKIAANGALGFPHKARYFLHRNQNLGGMAQETLSWMYDLPAMEFFLLCQSQVFGLSRRFRKRVPHSTGICVEKGKILFSLVLHIF